jgi:hypothetical protein
VTLPDTSAVAVRHAIQVPDTPGRKPRPVSARRMQWLGEPVAGSAATELTGQVGGKHQLTGLPFGVVSSS